MGNFLKGKICCSSLRNVVLYPGWSFFFELKLSLKQFEENLILMFFFPLDQSVRRE